MGLEKKGQYAYPHLCELDEELHKRSLLHVVVVEVIDHRCDESKVEHLQGTDNAIICPLHMI